MSGVQNPRGSHFALLSHGQAPSSESFTASVSGVWRASGLRRRMCRSDCSDWKNEALTVLTAACTRQGHSATILLLLLRNAGSLVQIYEPNHAQDV